MDLHKNKRLARNGEVSYSFVVFILFIGFTAVLQIPSLQGGDTDLALFKIAKDAFPPWIVGAAGMLADLVPCSMLILTAATILSKNIYKAVKPATSNEQLAKLTRIFVPIVSLVSLIFTFYGGNTMIALEAILFCSGPRMKEEWTFYPYDTT